MDAALRSRIVIVTAAIVAVVAVAFSFVTGDSAVEIAGDGGSTTTTGGAPSTLADATDASPGIDWEALLGTDDAPATDAPGSTSAAGNPPGGGTVTGTARTTAPDSTTTPSGPTVAITTSTTSTTIGVAVAGPTSSTTTAAAPTTNQVTTTVRPGLGSTTTTTTTVPTTTTTAVVSTTTTATTTTTTTTTTTSTTAAPTTTEPALAPFTRRFDSAGGSITVSWNGSSLSLDSVDPDRRHRVSVNEASATRISVSFIARGEDSYISVRVVGNELFVDIG